MFHGHDERVDQESLDLSTQLWLALCEDVLTDVRSEPDATGRAGGGVRAGAAVPVSGRLRRGGSLVAEVLLERLRDRVAVGDLLVG